MLPAQMMLEPSMEQTAVCDAIQNGHNVQLNAVPGSGKSTTVLCMAHCLHPKPILQLTYNSDLREETEKKRVKYSECMMLDNLTIHTYHSFAFKHYTPLAKTDMGINEILETNMQPICPLPEFHILVSDEAQDKNTLYFRFMCKVINDLYAAYPLMDELQIAIFGDEKQCLYEFKGADARFLTLAPRIWQSNTRTFKELKLSVSRRLTHPMSKFVNQCLLDENCIKTIKDGPKVEYMRHLCKHNVTPIGNLIIDGIKSGIVSAGEIFVIAGSVKGQHSHVKKLENMLVKQGIPCHVPMSETTTIHSNIIKNKVIFSSIHQTKGRERAWVIMFGFDKDYHDIFNRNAKAKDCPPTLFVATTRATKRLILVETADPLQCIKLPQRQVCKLPYILFTGTPQGIPNYVSNPNKKESVIKTTPTSLIKFLNEELMINITKKLGQMYDVLELKGDDIVLTGTLETTYNDVALLEDVSDLNGIIIPAMYQELVSLEQRSYVKQSVLDYLSKDNADQLAYYTEFLKDVDYEHTGLCDYLKIANAYNSMNEKLIFKLGQIQTYDWISMETVHALFDNMNLHIASPTQLCYEESLIEYDNDKIYGQIDAFMLQHGFTKMRFSARVDAEDVHTIWEFKCTEALEPEHQLQLLIYAWLYHKTNNEHAPKEFKLLNIRTGECQLLNYDSILADEIMADIITAKYTTKVKMSDDEFCQKHQFCLSR